MSCSHAVEAFFYFALVSTLHRTAQFTSWMPGSCLSTHWVIICHPNKVEDHIKTNIWHKGFLRLWEIKRQILNNYCASCISQIKKSKRKTGKENNYIGCKEEYSLLYLSGKCLIFCSICNEGKWTTKQNLCFVLKMFITFDFWCSKGRPNTIASSIRLDVAKTNHMKWKGHHLKALNKHNLLL